MATPNRAPRRAAASMNLNVASGAPVPGANAQTYTRKTATAGDASAYMTQRNAAKVGLNPGNVAVNKDDSPAPY